MLGIGVGTGTGAGDGGWGGGFVWQFELNWNVALSYVWVILLLGMCGKEMKPYVPKITYTQKLIAALFIIAKKWKQPNCPSTNESINKMWYMHTMEYY